MMFRFFTLIALLMVAAPVSATTYYVRTDGNNGNTGTVNSAGGAWLTIDYAADNVAAGDTVRVQAGTYAERITPAVNGTSGNAITFVADGTATFCGVTLADSAYLRFVGFVLDGNAGACSPQATIITVTSTSDHIEFWHNTIRDGSSSGLATSYPSARLNSSIFIGNVWTVFGSTEDNIVYAQGDHNLFGYNEWSYKTCDVANVEGTTNNRWINNYAHDLTSTASCHTDYWQAGSSAPGWAFNVYEANVQIGGAQTQEHTTNISNTQADRCGGGACGAMTGNIFRRNVWHNIGNGTVGINQTTVAAITNTRYYHNTTADACAYAAESADTRYSVTWYGTNPPGGFIHNNIEYNSWGTSVTAPYAYYVEGTLVFDYNLGFDSAGSAVTFTAPWTGQANPQTQQDPAFTSVAGDDFTIGVGSAAIGNGGPLTTTSGNGTGATFSVATGGGGFFVGSNASNLPQYSGALAPGDIITVGTDVRRVVSISGDAITVSEALTWADGEPVYFGADTTPDIGAYPYRATGYTLAANYSQVGTDVTIAANNADLVRFAVCFVDGIPVAVDNVAPFACTVGAGQVSVRVYPLFSSTTLWATASAGPAPPTGVIIRE